MKSNKQPTEVKVARVSTPIGIPPSPSQSESAKDGGSPEDAPEGSSANDGCAVPIPTTALLQSIGTAIGAAHEATKKVGVELVVEAAKCGLLLTAAKQILKRGEFEPWFEKADFGFTKVTRCKYMRLVEEMCQHAKSKPSLLLKVTAPAGQEPMSFDFDEVKLKAIIVEICTGKSLTDLYVEWDITKCAVGSVTKESGNGHYQIQNNGEDKKLKRWMGAVNRLPQFFASLHRDDQAGLLKHLESVLQQLRQVRDEAARELATVGGKEA